MLFHEIYGSYYQAVAAILREAARGTLTEKKLNALVQEHAFGESLLSIPDGLKGERWRLLRSDLSTPLQNDHSMPLTLLEKRWMKTLLQDPRISLFEPDVRGLEDVEPFFTPETVVYYDRYADGDDYRDPGYILHFRTILLALRENRDLAVCFESRMHARLRLVVTPSCLEYSEKDDRFRLIAAGRRRRWTINLSSITQCEPRDREEAADLEVTNTNTQTGIQTGVQKSIQAGTQKGLQKGTQKYSQKDAQRDRPKDPPKASVTFELHDRRNALERVLLHFSHLEKETKRLDENRYLVTLKYDRQDQTEMVIRILSFGPVIRVTEPESMISLLQDRIERQNLLFLKKW